MNSRGHLIVSLVKSGIRIVACVVATRFQSITILAFGFMIAELLGVLEEIVDKR